MCLYSKRFEFYSNVWVYSKRSDGHMSWIVRQYANDVECLDPYTGIWQDAINDFVKDYIEIMKATKSDKYINFDQINK
jgi:hypothetical protein